MAHPVELWPRLLQRREPIYTALHNFEHLEEHYAHQTALNILRVLDASNNLEKNHCPEVLHGKCCSFQNTKLWNHGWLLYRRKQKSDEGQKLQQELERCLEPVLQRAE